MASTEQKDCKENKGETTNSSTGDTSEEVHARKMNFIKACNKLSQMSYENYKKRFQLLYIPDCINNTCSHGGRNTNIKKISRTAELSFKAEFNASAWFEALEICIICTTPVHYLSAKVLQNVVEIMMNIHADLHMNYTANNILKRCSHTLMTHFNIHAPCPTKRGLRACYKDFLISPMAKKEFSNRNIYSSNKGIVSHCLSRLIHEISLESKDGTIIDEKDIPKVYDGVHRKRDKLQLYELLVRKDRIERCMLVLESIIYLIQVDLALWDARSGGSWAGVRSQRPLLAYILWPCSVVTPLCLKIMKLFAYYIHLQYPEWHIKTMSLWMNAAAQMFYMYGRSGNDYPDTRRNVKGFAKEFYKIIASLPSLSISKIIERIEPAFVRHLVGMLHTQHILNTTKNDILTIIILSFKNMPWDNYSVGEQESQDFKKTTVTVDNLMKHRTEKRKALNVPTKVPENPFPKFNLEQDTTEITQNHVINTLYITLVAYLEAYNIKNFTEILVGYNENESNCDEIISKPISACFVKQYRSIVKSLQELFIILNEEQRVPALRKLSSLINNYFA